MEVKHLIGLSLYFQFTENQVSSASNWHLFLIALVDKNNLYINSMQLARAFSVTCEFPPLGTKLLDSWKNAVRGEFRRCGCGKQHGAQRKAIGWLPKFYCTEFMVHFSTLCFPFWLYAPVKNQVFGCLLPEVCLYSAVSVLQGGSRICLSKQFLYLLILVTWILHQGKRFWNSVFSTLP